MNIVLSEEDSTVVYTPPFVCLMEFQIQEILVSSSNPYPEEENLY